MAEEQLESTRQLAERADSVPAARDEPPASATQASAQQPPEAVQNGAAVALTITLAYETGWHEVYLHHCVEGKGAMRKLQMSRFGSMARYSGGISGCGTSCASQGLMWLSFV